MNSAALAAAIDAIDSCDPERAHSLLDDLLVEAMPLDVQEAVGRLWGRCHWWATA